MNARKCKHRISDHKRERGYACTIRILSLPYTNTITKIYFPLQVMASNDITQTFSQSDVLLIIMAHTILNTTTTIYHHIIQVTTIFAIILQNILPNR